MGEGQNTRPGLEGSRPAWHVMRGEEVCRHIATDPSSGLSGEEAASRLVRFGHNRLEEAARTPAWRMFLSQFNDFMIWVLMAAVGISAVEGQLPEAIAISVILLLNGVLGFVQEYRADKALEALREMAAPTATVIRDGVETEVPAADLVPGDVVVLEAGDKVPADGRLVEAAALKHEEASLTGESMPVGKTVDALDSPDVALGDRRNMAYAGTVVAAGRGRMVVTETGQDTEVGKIADMLAAQEEESTPLKNELRAVGKKLAVLVLAIAAVVFALGVWDAWSASGLPFREALAHESFRENLTVALLVAISLAVAAIPEGLPAVVTVSLSLGVRRMAERHAIVRKLHAVETLGSTTFVCTDKTGTLTKNEMRARRVVAGLTRAIIDEEWRVLPEDGDLDFVALAALLETAGSANDARQTPDGRFLGDPTETALLEAALRIGTIEPAPRVAEVPFDSARKRMTTVHSTEQGHVVHMKGAPDIVLSLCDSALLDGEKVPLTQELLAEFMRANEELASAGFRTLAFAQRRIPKESRDDVLEGDLDADALESGMTYLGLIGLQDPPRPEVAQAIATAHSAGMEVAMVTGDHALTARAIGEEIGLLHGGRVITGRELGDMDDSDLERIVEDVRIYARVDPEHKLRIVNALKARGHVVAMTGDGVNDAPALKRADIGVAMGLVGTDVSREAADMVLTDDNFATIIDAVREGRAVFDNLKKFILFLLSCNVSEVLIIFLTMLIARQPALLPLQILWINLVTDGLPALALGVDPASPDVMERPPRRPDEGILTRQNQAKVAWQGFMLTAGGLLAFVWSNYIADGVSPERAHTILFTVMVLAQILHSFDFRSETRSVWSTESLKNEWLVRAAIGSVVLHLAVVYLPPLQKVFGTTALGATDWVAVIACALVPVIVIDASKVLAARLRRRTARL
ncbi:MAG: calcium-transporting P-type ATPase, PMR1-type [Coriobacteriia bacterium]